MIIGYILKNLLGLSLITGTYMLRFANESRYRPGNRTTVERCRTVARRGLCYFYDCAISFTFSIQIACIVVLARLDFGISASGMGTATADITYSISLITMLPLMYLLFLPDLLRDPVSPPPSNSKDQKSTDRREQLRFLLFALCWMLSMYPFLSKMLETLEPSMIGGYHSVISTQDWETIVTICTGSVDQVTQRETTAMQIFGTAGSVFVCIMTIVKISWLALNRQCQGSRLLRSFKKFWMTRTILRPKFPMVLFIVIPLLAITQMWTIFRLRDFQTQVSQASGNNDLDSEWTFGQVAAVTIFVPVVVECWFSWLYE